MVLRVAGEAGHPPPEGSLGFATLAGAHQPVAGPPLGGPYVAGGRTPHGEAGSTHDTSLRY